MAELNNSYIFRCSNKTEQECFDRHLFGELEKLSRRILEIKTGDTLFLYNVDTSLLYGVFTASSDGKKDIQSDAWKGKFPWQVAVSMTKDYEPLHKSEIDHLIQMTSTFSKFHPLMRVDASTTRKLITLFKSKDRKKIVQPTSSIKPKGEFRCTDGHWVRSKWEQDLDEWLFDKRICHGYEHHLNLNEEMWCDFFIPKSHTLNTEDVYIELWGQKTKSYLARQAKKRELYAKYELTLIDVYPEDLPHLDERLLPKLQGI
jgi:hypothetical protein